MILLMIYINISHYTAMDRLGRCGGSGGESTSPAAASRIGDRAAAAGEEGTGRAARAGEGGGVSVFRWGDRERRIMLS
jgi:hypothetical protein